MKLYFLSFLSFLFFSSTTLDSHAQGWPENYGGVMLQGFYWDSFYDTQWKNLESQADELAEYFDLIWVPQSGFCSDGLVMGYLPLYYFNQNSSFGSDAELRKMIATFKEKGLLTIEDVVINHRGSIGDAWFNVPPETYNGVTYTFQSTDVCKNDDNGGWLSWAQSQGLAVSANNDTGEGWSGARDIDHKSGNVNSTIKAYLNFLINDLGYAGFRYDMVKGYSASFTADYNTASKPQFSVGEYWDSSSNIKNWINGTKKDGVPQSAAFDFQFRYRVRDAVNQNDWTQLKDNTSNSAARPLIYDSAYRRYAVTFVENHDTEKRANAAQDPLKADTLAANAYLLAMPGTPCVFLKHWQQAKGDIKRMIAARKLVGINNQSTYVNMSCAQLYYSVLTTGSNGKLLCVVGKTPEKYEANTSLYTKILERDDFIYYISKELVPQWNEIERKIQNENFSQDEFTPHTATIYVRDELGWSRMNFYIWDSNNNTQLNGNWPGKQITDTKIVNGNTWYYQTFNINQPDYYVNVVFNTNSGSPQTIDLNMISEDKFFVIKTDMFGSKYMVEDDEETLGVNNIINDFSSSSDIIYNIAGQRVTSPQPNHIYIRKGKKILFRR